MRDSYNNINNNNNNIESNKSQNNTKEDSRDKEDTNSVGTQDNFPQRRHKLSTLPVFMPSKSGPSTGKVEETKGEDKQFWVPDDHVQNCYNCGSKFFSLVNRKHHCRICGNIFCKKCFATFTDKNIYDEIRELKVCSYCEIKYNEFYNILSNNLVEYQNEEGNKRFETKTWEYVKNREEIQDSNKFCHFNKKEDTTLMDKFHQSINDNYEILLNKMINKVLTEKTDKNKYPYLSKEWGEVIFELTKKVIANVSPSFQDLNDSIDINEYIKIKTIPYYDKSKCQVIDGFAMQKNVSSKKMLTEVKNPKILLLRGSLEGRRIASGSDSILVKASAVEDYIEILRKKIESIKPQIIIVENSASQKFQDFFSSENMNISLVTKCNIKKLERIARCVKTFVLPSADLIGKQILLGSCKVFKVETFKTPVNYSNGEGFSNNMLFMRSNEYNLMRFEGCGKVLFNTVILSGPNKEELKEIKRLMKIITKTARFLFCQKYILRFFNMYYEPKLNNNINNNNKKEISKNNNKEEENKNNEISNNINKAIEDEEEEEDNKNHINFINDKNRINENSTKENENNNSININNIKNEELNFEYGFDTQILDDQENEFECVYTTMQNKKNQDKELFQARGSMIAPDTRESSNNIMSPKESQVLKSVPTQCTACSYTMNAYSKDENEEATLGQNICKLLEEGKEKCEKCDRMKMNHTSYMYKDRGRIKISMFGLSDQQCKIDKALNNLGLDDKFRENTLFLSKKESNIVSQEEIYSYGYCEICGEIVTPVVLLPKEIVNFSGTKFYQNLLYNHNLLNYCGEKQKKINNFIGDNTDLSICKEKNHCHYKDISRIFFNKNGAIKFQYEDVIKYKLIGSQLNNKNSNYYKIFYDTEKEEQIVSDKQTTLIALEAIKTKFFVHKEILELTKSKIINNQILSLSKIVEENIKFVDDLIKKNEDVFIPSEYENIFKYYVVLKRYCIKIMNMKIMVNKIAKIVKKIIKIIFFEECEESNRILREQELKNDLVENEDMAAFINLDKDNLDKKYKPGDSFKLTATNTKKRNLSNFNSSDSSESIIGFTNSSNNLLHHSMTTMQSKKKPDSFKLNLEEHSSFKKGVNTIIEGGKAEFDINALTVEISSKRKSDDDSGEGYFKEQDGEIDEDEEIEMAKEKEKENKEGKEDNEDEKSKNNLRTNSIGFSFNSELKKKMNEKYEMCFREISSYFYNIEELDKEENIQKIIGKLNLYDKKHSSLSTEPDEEDLCSLITYALTSDQYLDLIKIDNKNGLNEIKRDLKNVYEEEGDNKLFCNTSLLYDRENVRFSLGDFPEEKIYQILGSDLLSNDNVRYLFEVNYNPITLFNEVFEKKDEEELKSNHKIKYHDLNNFLYLSNNKIQQIKKDLQELLRDRYEELSKKFTKFPKANFFDKEKAATQDLKITSFYPKQFEALRILYCASYNEFLNAINKSHEWSSVTGGKSKARFLTSNDDRFVVKLLSENEFHMFIDSCFHYFIHNNKYFFFKMPSSLVKILGAYRIRLKGNKKFNKYCVIMENLNYLLGEENGLTKVTYDLKGSSNNRYVKEKENGRVLMDTNFLEDFEGEPLVLDPKIYTLLLCAISNDTKICRTMGVIDYSLLCVIVDYVDKDKNKNKEEDNNNNKVQRGKTKYIRLGVLDYFRKYTWDKQLEHFGKTIMHKFTAPTIINPKKYDERFFKKLRSYFIGA